MKNLLFTSVFCFLCSAGLMAQDFDTAAGLRLGSPVGVSIKKFITDSGALEGYGGLRIYPGGSVLSLHAAYLVHKDLTEDIDNLQWYFGGGAGFFLDTFGNNSASNLGFQGYIGASYTLSDAPINISLDWVPTITLGNGIGGLSNGFGSGFYSLGVRYILSGQGT